MAAINLLPLDLSGKALANRITQEAHTLVKVKASTNRVIMLNYGAFYEDNLKVYDSKGTSLKPGVDFIPTYFYDEFQALTGYGVYGMIVVLNSTIEANVTVDYRALGGDFSLSVPEVKAVLEAIKDGNMTVKFSDIVGRPTAYIPADHQHEWWQVIAMYSTVEELNRLRDTVGLGEEALNDQAGVYGQLLVDECQKVVSDFAKAAQLHYSDTNNPHQTTKVQLNLGNVNNWAVATDAESVNSAQSALYLSPSGAYQILAAGYLPSLAAHLSDYNNPHGVTAAQLGAYTKAQIDSKLSQLLDRNATAYNTALFAGKNYATLAAEVRSNIPVGNVVSGRFNPARLGDGSGSWETILMGNRAFRSIRNLFDTYEQAAGNSIWFGSFTSGDEALSALNSIYNNPASFPAGTYAFARIRVMTFGGDRWFWETNYWVRTASGWVSGSGR